jgi:hypothetical protein
MGGMAGKRQFYRCCDPVVAVPAPIFLDFE